MFKFSLGSFGAFPIFGNLVSRKEVVVERNGPKFGPQRQVFRAYRVLFTVNLTVQRSVWGQSVHFHFWRPWIYFWLKYSGIFVVPSVQRTGILSRKWLGRASRPLGFLFSSYYTAILYPTYFEIQRSFVIWVSLNLTFQDQRLKLLVWLHLSWLPCVSDQYIDLCDHFLRYEGFFNVVNTPNKHTKWQQNLRFKYKFVL